MIFSFFVRFLMIFEVVILGSILFPAISTAQTKVEVLLNELDKHYYYPQKNGLLKISARLEWEQQDIKLGKKTFLKNPDFLFYVEFKARNMTKSVKIDDNRVMLSDDEKLKYTSVLNNYLDVFMPKTLHEKFSEYRGKARIYDKNKILLKLETGDSLDKIQSYELLVDTDKWRLSGLRIRQNHEPLFVEGKFLYTRKEGKWMVEEAFSDFTIDGQKYSEKTEYTYKKIQSYWLINKVKQSIRQDGRNIFVYRFRLDNYKINSGYRRKF